MRFLCKRNTIEIAKCNKNTKLIYLCKTITTDSGLEFVERFNLANIPLAIYFSWKYGSNKRYNCLHFTFLIYFKKNINKYTFSGNNQ